jgi:hypothetical protein
MQQFILFLFLGRHAGFTGYTIQGKDNKRNCYRTSFRTVKETNFYKKIKVNIISFSLKTIIAFYLLEDHPLLSTKPGVNLSIIKFLQNRLEG